jgi:hypothetical protein
MIGKRSFRANKNVTADMRRG